MNMLQKLYSDNHSKLISVREELAAHHLEGPLVMDLEKYWEQPVKLLVIGQETYGWNCDYDDLESLRATYRNFNMGEEYYSSPFWNITRKIENLIGIPNYSCAWSNLNRYDYEGGPVPESLIPKISELDDIVKGEIEAISPDVCLFYTNHKYDTRLHSLFPDMTLEDIPGLRSGHFAKITHPDLPKHTYRTPHPKTIRINKWEDDFMAVMQEILPTCEGAS